MANSKYEDIYQLLNDYNFQIDIELHPDLSCAICKKVLNKPYQSQCGCRYCFSCIKNHIKSGNKFCSGASDECQEQPIDIDRYLQCDHVANKRISEIKVKCPEKTCTIEIELKNMMEHLNSHSMNCPFFEIGCNQSNINSQSLKDHMTEESYTHTILLMESMKNTKNEYEILKENLQKKDRIIANMSKDLKIAINKHNNEIASMKKEILMLKNILKIENRIPDNSSASIKINKDGLICDFTEEESIGNADSETSSHFSEIRRGRFMSSTSSLRNASANQEIAPFEWKLNNFENCIREAKLKNREKLYSKPFLTHKNGYKLRLRINPNGFGNGENTHLSVFFSIIEGQNDELLFWPMKRQVTVGILNQTTRKLYYSDKYKFEFVDKDNQVVFDKPSTRIETGDYYFYGTQTFMKLNKILNDENLMRNGTIVLKCYIN